MERFKFECNSLEPNKKDIPTYYCAIQGSRTIDDFEFLNKIEEGTYGIVYRAKDKRTSKIAINSIINFIKIILIGIILIFEMN